MRASTCIRVAANSHLLVIDITAAAPTIRGVELRFEALARGRAAAGRRGWDRRSAPGRGCWARSRRCSRSWRGRGTRRYARARSPFGVNAVAQVGLRKL